MYQSACESCLVLLMLGLMRWWTLTIGVLVLATGVVAATTQMSWLVLLPVLTAGLVMGWIMHSTGSRKYPWAVPLALGLVIAHEARGDSNFAAVMLVLFVATIVHAREARRESDTPAAT